MQSAIYQPFAGYLRKVMGVNLGKMREVLHFLAERHTAPSEWVKEHFPLWNYQNTPQEQTEPKMETFFQITHKDFVTLFCHRNFAVC